MTSKILCADKGYVAQKTAVQMREMLSPKWSAMEQCMSVWTAIST